MSQCWTGAQRGIWDSESRREISQPNVKGSRSKKKKEKKKFGEYFIAICMVLMFCFNQKLFAVWSDEKYVLVHFKQILEVLRK